MFDREQAVNRALVEASNPQPATLQVYLAAQGETKQAFMAVFNAHLAHLASLGQVSPETVTKVIEAASPLVK